MSDNTQATTSQTSDPVKDSLFKSLKLTVLQSPEPSKANEEPKLTPSGTIVPEVSPNSEQKFDTTTDDSLSGTLASIREEAKTAAEPAKVEPVVEAAKPDETKPEPTPVAVKSKKVSIQAPEPATQITTPAATPDVELPHDDSLNDEEKEEIDLARFAAKSNPEKYAGLDKKLEAFFKKHNEYLDQKLTEDPGFEADLDKNDDYRRWVNANQPAIPKFERRKLEKEMLIKRAKEEASAEADARIQEVSSKLREIEVRPRIAKSVDNFSSALQDILPDDISASLKTGTIDDDLPVEAEVVKNYVNLAKHSASEFLHLTQGLTKFDPKNPTHTWLGSFIHEQGTLFLKNGGKDLKKDGKDFIPRAEFNGLPQDRKEKYWSFTDEDVLNMLAYNAKATVEKAVSTEREKFERISTARSKKAGLPQKTTTVSTPTVVVDEDGSPRAAAAPIAPAGISSSHSSRDPLMTKILGSK